MMKSILALLFCTLLLASCKQSSVKPKLELNLVEFNDIERYQILGKMSFSDGQDGGSGRIDWQFNNGYVVALLKAPLGSKSWEIKEFEGGAQIETNQGYKQISESAQSLISQELGWHVPWNELKHWIKGSPHLSNKSEVTVHNDGYDIREKGWVIQYSKLRSFETGELPMKIVARKDNYAIKVSIKSWLW